MNFKEATAQLLEYPFIVHEEIWQEIWQSMIAKCTDQIQVKDQNAEISSAEETHPPLSTPPRPVILLPIPWTMIRGMIADSKATLITRGRNAEIYSCYWEEAQLLVVVKLFDTEKENEKESYQSELNVINQLAHPNIIGRIGTATGHPASKNEWNMRAIVYRFEDGGSLQDHIGGLDWQQVLSIFQDIGSGLKALHDKGLVHDNILLNQDYEAKLADFGATKLDATEHDGVTSGYTDPELRRSMAVRPWHDMYGLGIILLQILADWKRPITSLRKKTITIYDWMLKETEQGRSIVTETLRTTGCNHVMEKKMLALTKSLCQEPSHDRPTSTEFTAMLRMIENEYMGREESEGLNQVHDVREESERLKEKGLKKFGFFGQPKKNLKKEKDI